MQSEVMLKNHKTDQPVKQSAKINEEQPGMEGLQANMLVILQKLTEIQQQLEKIDVSSQTPLIH